MLGATMTPQPNLVDPGMFLRGCREPLPQYRECLMTNLQDWGRRGLHRGKLSKVQMHQLSQMNIARFDHQKMIMARIRELESIPSMPRYDPRLTDPSALEAAVHLPSASSTTHKSRKHSTSSGMSQDTQSHSDESTSGRGNTTRNGGKHRSGKREKVKGGKRGSLALDKTWDSINKSRAETDGTAKQKQLGSIRRRKSLVGNQQEPKPVKGTTIGDDGSFSMGDGSSANTGLSSPGSVKGVNSRRDSEAVDGGGGGRRMSMHNPDPARQAEIKEARAKRQRAMEYGNNALKATTREGQLKALKKQILADFVDAIGCDRATLMFVDTPAQELFFFDGDTRISFSLQKGIAGYCASSGMPVIANDPYTYPHFNPQVDKDTGFVTRNILCEPVRSRRGGNVVGVLEMLNKRDGQDFTEQDAAVIEMCVVKVANALDTSFAALVSAENEWAKTAGRRRSSGLANADSIAVASALAVDVGGEEAGRGRRVSIQSGGQEVVGGRGSIDSVASELRELTQGPQISNRRGSGASRADAEKLKRRTDYGNEVRDSSVGLM